eukprot:TRINITY_DN62538_c0_g1_i1.p1 TRINITY_DN62538_c0_g1~~TRINITY_DN62538_c0_g1_i1.p1  ORF type:complete len:197 (+),score=50.60 TRINITY_DN62538_c0_g1_i1:51-641(+)
MADGAASSSSTAKARRTSTEDLLAAFKRKINERVERGERAAVHASSDRESKEDSNAKSNGKDRDRDKEKRESKKRPLDEEPPEDQRLGRGGRLTQKRKPREVNLARGRNLESQGTLSRPRSVKVTNIPASLEWRYVKELFESAAGKILDGRLENGGTAFITFKKPDSAKTAHKEFDGGELADQVISVEMLPEEDDD